MHIIALENEPSSFRGGQELNLLDVCRGLSQRGHYISLLYVTEGNLLQQYQDFCTNIVQINGYMFEQRSITSILNFLTGIWKVRASKNSVIYSNQHRDTFFGSTLSILKNIPLVCHLQLPPPKTFERHWTIGLKGVKQFIAVSNQTKSDWVSRGFKENKIDVVYNGTNPEVFKPFENFYSRRYNWNIPEDNKVISYVGRLHRKKGVETLIKAFALIMETGTSTRLLIAGKPLDNKGEDYKKSLEQLSNNLGIEKYVNFLGHVTNTNSLYQISDVTVLPSLHSEPFGRVIIESMACGTPVVASRTGGITEILTGEFQSGLFEPGNERDLANKLKFIMNWRDRNPHLAERCRDHVLNNFSLDRMIDGIEKILLKVVKQ